RMSTGGGFSTRELYENSEEILFNVQRPVALNSIEDVAQRGDLLERSIIIRLPTIPDERRRTETKLLTEFNKVKPQILGAILDVVSAGLKNLANVKLDRLPRMADFAQWITACEPALGWEPGSFMRTYCDNLREGNQLALESSVVVAPIR